MLDGGNRISIAEAGTVVNRLLFVRPRVHGKQVAARGNHILVNVLSQVCVRY